MNRPARLIRLLALALAAAVSLPLACVAAMAAEAPEASIPFADHGGISNWQPDGERGLWVQSSHNTWYYGSFAAPCFGLQFHETLKFRFSPSGSLDRFTQIETRDSGSRCWFKSFKASDGPPQQVTGKGPGKDQGKGQDGVAAPATAGP